MSRRRGALLAVLVIASVATALVVHRLHVLEPNESPFFGSSDVYAYFYPNALFLQAELQRGNLPSWNPYQFAGQPFLGLHVTGSLYPPNLVAFALLGAGLGLEGLFLLHPVITGFFAWLFARRLGLGFVPSLAGALVNALSLPSVLDG